MNAKGGPPEARLAPWSRFSLGGSRLDRGEYSTGQAKEGTSADSAEEMKDTTAVRRWRLHFNWRRGSNPLEFPAVFLMHLGNVDASVRLA
jgi:hypothetical protein